MFTFQEVISRNYIPKLGNGEEEIPCDFLLVDLVVLLVSRILCGRI